MVKVATLKEQAREYERQGDIDKALAIYGHILTHLEGTPAIRGQLPLYVKVGDLQLKQGDTESAISMYERAADHYAEHGSAKSVIALCLKILRVAPKHTTVYLTYARRLLLHGHVSSARDVLTDFAERASLQKPLENLRRLRGRPDTEVRPVLERMLAGVRKPEEPSPPEPEQAEPRDEAPVRAPGATVRESAPAEAAPAQPPLGGRQLMDAAVPGERLAAVARRPGEIQSETVEETQVSASAAATQPPVHQGLAAAPATEDLSWMRHGASEATTATDRSASRAASLASPSRKQSDRRPFEGFARDAERRKATSRFWLVGALILILAAIGGAFVKLGVIPVELGPLSGPKNDPPVNAPTTPAAQPQPAAIADSVQEADSLAPDSVGGLLPAADSGVVDSLSGAAGDTTAPAASRQPAAAPPGTTPPAAPRIDTVARRPARPPPDEPSAVPEVRRDPEVRVSNAPRFPAGTALRGPVVVIQGLAIDSVTEFPSGDLVGLRVIHVLDSGEPLILRAVPVGPAMGDTATSGAPRVTTLRGDTAFGTRVFAGYLVNAKGKVGSDRLDTLLRHLVRLEPNN